VSDENEQDAARSDDADTEDDAEQRRRDNIFEGYLFENEVAETLHKTRRTLRAWRQQRIGPPWVKPTRDLILYPRVGFRDWLKAIEVGSIGGSAM
jgi:hypothetical protein